MIFHSDALADLDEIYEFIAADDAWAADSFFELLLNACATIARSPGIGHRRRDLTLKDVLFWSVRGYVIVYRRQQRSVEIVAVTQGSREVAQLLHKRLSSGELA